MDIAGKAALVTGGGSGIGRATALAFADRGARHIHLVDISERGCAETAEMLAARGTGASIHICNVADMAALEQVFDAAAAETGLDIVFNNAGVVTGANLFPAATVERMSELFAINMRWSMAPSSPCAIWAAVAWW